MRIKIVFFASALFLFPGLTVPGLAQEAGTSGTSDTASSSATSSPDLPEMPSTERNVPLDDAQNFEDSREANQSVRPTPTETRRSATRRLTPEQQEAINKEKNWLIEGMAEEEAKRKAALEENSAVYSVIDDILNKNQDQMDQKKAESRSTEPSEGRTYAPALNTSAFEPLPEIGNETSTPADQFDSLNQPRKQDWQAYDPETGVANVFYNPRTGGFESRPPGYTGSVDADWMPTNPATDTIEAPDVVPEKQIEAEVQNFEAQLLAEAKAQNKIPDSYGVAPPELQEPVNPNLIQENSSPYLMGTPNEGGAPGATGTMPGATANLNSQQNNQAAVARLRMIEEERQRQEKMNTRPDPMDIHSGLPSNRLSLDQPF